MSQGLLYLPGEANTVQIGVVQIYVRRTFKSQSHMHTDEGPVFTVAIATDGEGEFLAPVPHRPAWLSASGVVRIGLTEAHGMVAELSQYRPPGVQRSLWKPATLTAALL